MVSRKKIKNKIVIFGSSGFVGSNLADELSNHNFDLVLFDINNKSINNKKIKSIKGDIMDFNQVHDTVRGAKIVYNLAGESDIENSTKNIQNVINSNINGNINILNACIDHKVSKFIYASSMYVFGKYGGFYKTSKLTSEAFIKEYNKLYNLNYTILRFGSLFGSKFDSKSAIFNMISDAINKSIITYNGNEDSLRQYIHISDAVKASIKIISKKYNNQSVSIIGNESYRVKDIMILISEILNKKIRFKFKNIATGHYRLTPFTFNPDLGVTLKLEDFIDVPQGLYEEIKRISKR